MKSVTRLAVIAVLLAAPAVAGTFVAHARDGAGFDEPFRPGLYSIRPLDTPAGVDRIRNICVKDHNGLLRLQHSHSTGCQDRLVQQKRGQMTVTYSCPAQGWGRTELRLETPGLYQLDTQGISGKEPFALRAEARRTGDCPMATQKTSGR